MTDSAYELFCTGSALLDRHDYHAAVVPLSRLAEMEPNKGSVREALGRAYFGCQRYREAADEFAAVTSTAPTNDYALFCLGRCLQLLGRPADARPPLTQAALLRPDRADYRAYRDRAVRDGA